MLNNHKSLGLVLAVVLTALLSVSPATAINPLKQITAEQVSVIDMGQRGTLNIQFKSNEGEVVPAGIPVKIKRVLGIDISNQQDWVHIAEANVNEILSRDESSFSGHQQGVSGEAGSLSFSNLDLGLWVVESPEDAQIKFENFVVAIPQTEVNGQRWLYEFTVYPKFQTPVDPDLPDGLVPVPLPLPLPQSPTEHISKSEATSNGEKPEKPTSKLADTGTSALNSMLFGSLLVFAGLLIVLLQVRKKNTLVRE